MHVRLRPALAALVLVLAVLALPSSAHAADGTVSGTVTGPSGPQADVCVFVNDVGWPSGKQARTEPDGTYRVIGVPPGTKQVQFADCSVTGNLAPRSYSGTVTVGDGADVTGIDATMVEGAQVSGTVTGGGTGLDAMCVVLLPTASNGIGPSATTAANGTFSIRRIVPGSYRLYVQGCPPLSSRWVASYLGGFTPTAATVLTLGAGEVQTGRDVALIEGGRISGTVTDAAGPAAGACVSAQRQGDSFAPPSTMGMPTPVDATGAYTLQGLPPGGYKVEFRNCTSATSYLNEWNGDAETSSTAPVLTVTSGQTTSDVNAQLATGGAISGKVTDSATPPTALSNICVYAAKAGSPITTGAPTFTAANGTYTVNGLRPGTYDLQFSNCTLMPGATKSFLAKKVEGVTVTGGQTTAAGDVALVEGRNIRGRVVGAGNVGIQSVCVTATKVGDTTGANAGFASTNSAGEYTIGSLASGSSYKLRFSSCGAGNLEPEYYKDKADLASADAIAVADTDVTADTVTMAAGTPPETTITSGPSGTTPDTNATFAFASSKAGGWYQCRLDGGTWQFCNSPQTVGGLSAGEHTAQVKAFDASGVEDPTPASRTWTVDPAATSKTASGTAAAGGSVSSDPSGSAPTVAAVTVPSGGDVTITQGATTTPAPTGFALLGQQIQITAPAQSLASPLRLTFTLAGSEIPAGTDRSTVTVFRDGQPAADCLGASSVPGAASDPCITERTPMFDGGVRLVVLSSHASAWNLGRSTAPGSTTGTTTPTTPTTPTGSGSGSPSGSGSSSGAAGAASTASPAPVGGAVPTGPAVAVASKPAAKACVVPAVKGKKLAAAKKAITAAGCKLGKVKKVRGAKSRRGKVVAQAKAGRKFAAGAPVELSVGR